MGGSSWKTLMSYQSAPRFPRGVSQVLTPQKTFRSAKGDRFLQVLTPQAKFWGYILNLANDHQTSQFDFCVIGSHGMDFVWDSSMRFDWKHCQPTGRSPAGPEGTYWEAFAACRLKHFERDHIIYHIHEAVWNTCVGIETTLGEICLRFHTFLLWQYPSSSKSIRWKTPYCIQRRDILLGAHAPMKNASFTLLHHFC